MSSLNLMGISMSSCVRPVLIAKSDLPKTLGRAGISAPISDLGAKHPYLMSPEAKDLQASLALSYSERSAIGSSDGSPEDANDVRRCFIGLARGRQSRSQAAAGARAARYASKTGSVVAKAA